MTSKKGMAFVAFLWLVLFACETGMAQNRVTIQQKKIVVARSRQVSPGNLTIRYPVVSGVTPPALLKRLQAALMPNRTYHGSLKEIKNDTWLQNMSYTVNCNQNAVLGISYVFEGVAAYPDSFEEHLTLDLKTGKRLRVRDLFSSTALPQLIAQINSAMQADIKNALKNADKDVQGDIRERLSRVAYSADDLAEFTVTPKGVTFYHNFDFPHVIEVFEPKGRYFFPYSSLKPYIRRDGLLQAFLK